MCIVLAQSGLASAGLRAAGRVTIWLSAESLAGDGYIHLARSQAFPGKAPVFLIRRVIVNRRIYIAAANTNEAVRMTVVRRVMRSRHLAVEGHVGVALQSRQMPQQLRHHPDDGDRE
jgi:hypothetical protein